MIVSGFSKFEFMYDIRFGARFNSPDSLTGISSRILKIPDKATNVQPRSSVLSFALFIFSKARTEFSGMSFDSINGERGCLVIRSGKKTVR